MEAEHHLQENGMIPPPSLPKIKGNKITFKAGFQITITKIIFPKKRLMFEIMK